MSRLIQSCRVNPGGEPDQDDSYTRTKRAIDQERSSIRITSLTEVKKYRSPLMLTVNCKDKGKRFGHHDKGENNTI